MPDRLLTLASFTLLLASIASAAPPTRLTLDRDWQFRQTPTAEATPWHHATVPGDIHLDLLANSLIPEPFLRDNESRLQSLADSSWQYRTSIHADAALLRRPHIEIVFDGLDSEAEVQLNGHSILDATDAFRGFRVDAKPWLRLGPNELLVTFPPPAQSAARLAVADRWRGKTPAADKTYLRKPAYEYGWDWGPTFVTSGIWQPVILEAWDDARIDDLYLRQRNIQPTLARIEAQILVVASRAQHATLTLVFGLSTDPPTRRHTLIQPVNLIPGDNHLVLPVEIRNPALWYPNGYGAQPLYTCKATLSALPAAPALDTRDAQTGLRSVLLRRDPDQWGRSFEFVVNGIPIFAKGADVIPFDSFPSRVTEPQYRRILQSAKDANMNMVRDWGGGYYESETYYRIADQLGIMIWQDFMFGNDWQPGSDAFRQQVAAEAEYQVTRLRNHPSIVLWCGNNETEMSLRWAKNDMVKTLDTAGHVRIWQDYLLLFSSTLPSVVATLNPETPYWPSSPSANYQDDLPPGQHTGDSHNWDVWHGRVPFSTYETHNERFVSEYGFQSFPALPTIESFTDEPDRASIFTTVMLAHQKNDEGNSIIHDYMLRDYAEPKDFPSFLYASQVLQAEGIKLGAEHLRRIRPQNMGSLFWQLNDCWPVASWSSIDYYGRWKALQFYARRFYSPLLVSPHVEDGALAVYVVSDKTTPQQAELRLRLIAFTGSVLSDDRKPIAIPALSSAVYLHLPIPTLLPAGIDPAQVAVVAELRIAGKVVSSNLIYLVPTRQVHLAAAAIVTDLAAEPASGPAGVRIRLTSPVLARAVHLELNLPAVSRPNLGDSDTLADDFFDLLPGEPVDILVKTSASVEAVRAALHVMSLADAFEPAR